MEGGFQRSLQLFVVNGYCVFEDDVCADLSGVLDRKPNYANAPFSGLFVGPCMDRSEVMDEGLIMLLPFFQSSVIVVGAPLSWRLPGLQRSRCKVVRRGDFDHNISDSSFSLIFSSSFSSSFHLFLFFFLSPLPFLLCLLAISLV